MLKVRYRVQLGSLSFEEFYANYIIFLSVYNQLSPVYFTQVHRFVFILVQTKQNIKFAKRSSVPFSSKMTAASWRFRVSVRII